MQTPLPPPLKSNQIGFLLQKVAQYSEPHEKTIFRFLVFVFWSIVYSKYLENWQNRKDWKWPEIFFVSKDAQCAKFWDECTTNFQIPSIFFFEVWYRFFHWRSQRGSWPPPQTGKSRGQTIIWPPPPHSRCIHFFSSNIHNTLLFIVYLINREGNYHLMTFSDNVCFFFLK